MAKRLLGHGKATSFPDPPRGKVNVEERVHAEDRSQGYVVYEVDACPECEGCGCKRCNWEGVFEDEVPAWAAAAWADAPPARRAEVMVNCCFCGKDLTDALSQERGYGPICAGKYGLTFDTTEPPAEDLPALFDAMVEATDPARQHVAERARACYSDNKKVAAKRLAWLLSFVSSGRETDAQLRALAGLGFHSMAGLIATQRDSNAVRQASKRKCQVSIIDTQYGRQIAVKTPCKPKGDGMERERELPGRRWDPTLRVVRYPLTSWDAVMAWVLAYYPLSEIPERPTEEIEKAAQKAEVKEEKKKAEKVRLSLLSKRIAIESPYHRGFVEEIKALPDRLWMCLECGKPGRPKCEDHPKGVHVWTVPLDRAEQVKELVKRYFPQAQHTVSSQLAEALEAETRKVQAAHATVAPIVELPGGTLYPFQGAGVRYLEAAGGCAIIADEQGLGKTVQAIAYAKRNVNFAAGEMVLYVVPSNVKYNWASEIMHWLAGTQLNDTKLLRRFRREGTVTINGVEVSVLSGKPKNGELPKKSGSVVAQHVIVNYDILKAWKDLLMAAGYALVVADEGHNLKNEKAARTEAFEEIAKDIPRTVILTGTPVLNRPRDLWNLLKIIDPVTWGNFFKFMQRYTNAQQKWAGRRNGFKWDFNGAANTDELHSRLDGHQWIRRLKADVLKELPPKQRIVVPLDIDDASRRAYERVERDCAKMMAMGGGRIMAAQDMDKDERAVVIAQITRLRVAAGNAKVKAVCDWVEDLVESVGKVVVFAHHSAVVEALTEKFSALKIDGSVSPAKRAEVVAEFQSNPDARVIVCSIQAASVGITLTAASHVVLAERVWRAKDHDQAEDRIHRIGQEGSVTAWYLDVPDTFDEAMREINNWKAQVADEIVDGASEAVGPGAMQMALDYFAERAN